MRTSSQQIKVQRAIDDVKSVFCKKTRTFVSLNSILFTRFVCLDSFLLISFILSSAQTWSLAEIDSKSVPPYLLK